MYHNMDDLIDVCVVHMANDQLTPEQVRSYMKDMLPKLNYWKQYKNLAGAEKFEEFKQQLIDEINALHVEGMPKVECLNALVGGYINLEYRLPNGTLVKFLDDGATYLGNQLECEFDGDRCFGIAANMDLSWYAPMKKTEKIPNWLFIRKDRLSILRLVSTRASTPSVNMAEGVLYSEYHVFDKWRDCGVGYRLCTGSTGLWKTWLAVDLQSRGQHDILIDEQTYDSCLNDLFE